MKKASLIIAIIFFSLTSKAQYKFNVTPVPIIKGDTLKSITVNITPSVIDSSVTVSVQLFITGNHQPIQLTAKNFHYKHGTFAGIFPSAAEIKAKIQNELGVTIN